MTRTRWISIIVVGSSALGYLVWEIGHRGAYLYDRTIYLFDDADEWRYVACSRLVAHGYRLFDQVFSAQPPLLFASLGTGMRLFGDSIDGARWVVIVFGLLALISAAWLATSLSGPIAGAATALLLVVSPAFLVYSHTIEAEIPMTALATLSLAVLAQGRRSDRLAWPILGGVALAAAVLTKLFAAEAFLPGAWLLLACARPRGRSLKLAAAFGGTAAILVIVDFALISPAAQWRQVVQMHERAARIRLPDLISAPEIVWRFLSLDPGLTVLALVGLVVLLMQRDWYRLTFLALWLPGSVAMLLFFRPLFGHHAAILITALAVTAGGAVSHGIAAVRTARVRPAVLAIVVAGIYAIFLPRIVHSDRHALGPAADMHVSPLTAYISARTSADQFIAVDDLRIADTARRYVPPPLCDPSTVRLRSGYLSLADLVDATREYHVRLVVLSPGGVFSQVPAYHRWVERHFRRAGKVAGNTVFSRS